MKTLAVINIRRIVSGDIANPLLMGDALLIEGGSIRWIGSGGEIDLDRVDTVVDAAGTVVTPGLIDSHCHPVLGDYTPRVKMSGFIESGLHGGVTTMISAGEVHLPGRPRDPAGVKAEAILVSKSFRSARPAGVKVHAGAVILEPELTESDFEEMARNGVWLVGEIGLGGVHRPEEAAPMVAWARKHGMKTMMHCGGQSMPQGTTATLEDILRIRPDVVSHLNGGPTAMALDEVEALVRDTDFVFDLVTIGNPKVRVKAIEWAERYGALSRVMIGSDCPGGFGWPPYAILRTVVDIAAVNGISPEVALAMATGNTARGYGLAGVGTIAPAKEADLVIMDAPLGSQASDALEAIALGDIPGISLVMVDGEVLVQGSNFTPPPRRHATVSA